MYNSFIYQRSQTAKLLNENFHKHSVSETKKHQGKTYVKVVCRNKLANKYNKRVENFIYKMEQNPIEIQEYNNFRDQTPEKYKHKSHKNDFKFNRANWENLVNLDQKNQSKLSTQSMLLVEKQDKFRQRSREKQIHKGPMRFNYIPKIVKKMRMKRNYVIIKNNQQDNQSFKKVTSFDESSLQDAFSSSQFTKRKLFFPGFGNSTIKTTSKDSQIKNQPTEAQQQKKTSNRLYFKALIDLSHKQRRLSKAAKQVLQKCKLVNSKYEYDESQNDIFSSYHNQG